jgi:ribonuclease HII
MPRKKFDLSLLPPCPDLKYEADLWQAGVRIVAGVDEAGRGALAGPVAAGVVVLPNQPDLQKMLDGVQDSKQMTAKSRQHWAQQIKSLALGCQVGFAEAEEVDELSIIPATRLAAIRAISMLPHPPGHLLIDHISIPGAGIPETSLIKGDRRSLSIAAASILAKVQRDEIMIQIDNLYPEYGFADHKGYGTAQHMTAIERHGPCPIHRMSFAPLRPDATDQPSLF